MDFRRDFEILERWLLAVRIGDCDDGALIEDASELGDEPVTNLLRTGGLGTSPEFRAAFLWRPVRLGYAPGAQWDASLQHSLLCD